MGVPANELRIGNWVNEKVLGDCRVVSIWELQASLNNGNDDADYAINAENLYPIPLTAEILLACGFEKEKEANSAYLMKNGTGKNQCRMRVWLADYPRHCGKWFPNEFQTIEIDYLHQLQNLYFALTGEELNYSPGEQK